MRRPPSRRDLLAAGGLAGLGALSACGPSSSASAIAIEPLADGVAVLRGDGANVLAVSTGDGALLVDTGAAEQASTLVRAAQRATGERRVAAAFNTHWHHENTGGNAVLRQAGVSIHAHRNTRLWLGADFVVPWQDRHYRPLAEQALPDRTFYGDGVLSLGDISLAYGWLPQAHTDGDVYVSLPHADVLAVGDLVSVDVFPVLDWATGGWIGGMADAAARLLEIAGPNTQIVPSVGPVVGRTHLEAQHAMLVEMRDRLIAMLKQGKSAQEMLDAGVARGFEADWGDPTFFVLNAYPGLWGHQNEFDGIT